MASIAEQLIGTVAQGTQQTGSNIQQGAQLAQGIQQVQQNRQRIEQAKEQLQLQKVGSITSTLELAAKSKDPKTRNFLLKNVVPGKVKALGMDEFFTPESLEFMQSSPEALQKVMGLQLELEDKVNRGDLTGAEAYKKAQSILQDPEQIALLDTDRLFVAQKFAAEEEGKGERAEAVAKAQLGRQMQAQQAAPSVTAAREIAKEYADFTAGGGRAVVEKNLSRLENAAKKLEAGKVKTGQVSNVIPGLRSDVAQDVLNPEVAALRDDVRGAIQGTLRQVLGAQFTEKEGEAIFNRAFNPRLSAEENARRIRQEVEGLRKGVKDKLEQFRSQGFKVSSSAEKSSGKRDKVSTSFSPNEQQKKAFQSLSPEEQNRAIQDLAKRFKMTADQIRAKLGL